MKMPTRDVPRAKKVEHKPAAPKADPVAAELAALRQEVRALRADLHTFVEAHKNVPWNFKVTRTDDKMTGFLAVPEE